MTTVDSLVPDPPPSDTALLGHRIRPSPSSPAVDSAILDLIAFGYAPPRRLCRRSVDVVLSHFLPAPPSPSPGGADAADGGSNLKVASRKRRVPEPPAEQPQVARPGLWEVDVESIAEEDLLEFVSTLERLKADFRARADVLASSLLPPPQPQH